MNTRKDDETKYQALRGVPKNTLDDCKPSVFKRAKQKKKNGEEGGIPYLGLYMNFYGR